MKPGGTHWGSAIAGILFVLAGWLIYHNLPSPRSSPNSSAPPPLSTSREIKGGQQGTGARKKRPPLSLPPQANPAHKPFELCLKDAVTGLLLKGGEILDFSSQKVLGRTGKDGCLSLKDLDPGVILIHCPGYFFSLIPEDGRRIGRQGGRVLVSLFPASASAYVDIRTVWPKGIPQPKGRLRIRVDRYGPPSVGERSYPTARFGEATQVSPEARRAWENHSLLADSVRCDESWFLGGYGGVSLPPSGGRIYFPHRGKFLLRARDDSGKFWAQVTIQINGRDQAPIVLHFTKGRVLSFFIKDPAGKPVPSARVLLTFPREVTGGRYEDLSDEKGFVQLQGIAETQGGHLEVFSPDFKVKKFEMPTFPKKNLTIHMEPLPSESVSFLVQEIKSHKPLSEVEVLVGNPAHPNQTSKSDSSGRVRVKLIRGQVRTFTLRKKGYLTYGELLEVNPGFPLPRIFEMVPADPEAQRKLGLVALIKGTILNSRGQPLAGAPVYLAVNGEGFIRIPNAVSRRVIRGAVPKSVVQTQSDSKGNFLLISANTGKARLIWGGEPSQQREFVVKPGQVLHFRLVR